MKKPLHLHQRFVIKPLSRFFPSAVSPSLEAFGKHLRFAWVAASLLLSSVTYPLNAQMIPVERTINRDSLVTINGIPWAANNWPFSKVIQVQRDSIDPSIVGRLVLDRHGEDDQPLFGIRAPFSGPRPGRGVIVSAWGSFDGGCFAELIFQVATTSNRALDPKLIIPTRIEMLINGQRLTLNALDNPGVDRFFSFRYTYSNWEERNDEYGLVDYSGVWVMARHTFLVDAETANVLRNAPVQDIPIRVTLTNLSPITFPIGDGTVERWPSVFSYNPSCRPQI